MTEKQKKFCIEYLKDLNATQAAIRSGYSENTAYSIGNENLSKPEIKNFIDEQISLYMSDSKKILEARIVNELKKLALDPMIDEESKMRHSDKLKALELLGKYVAMFTDKLEHSVDETAYNALQELYDKKRNEH